MDRPKMIRIARHGGGRRARFWSPRARWPAGRPRPGARPTPQATRRRRRCRPAAERMRLRDGLAAAENGDWGGLAALARQRHRSAGAPHAAMALGGLHRSAALFLRHQAGARRTPRLARPHHDAHARRAGDPRQPPLAWRTHRLPAPGRRPHHRRRPHRARHRAARRRPTLRSQRNRPRRLARRRADHARRRSRARTSSARLHAAKITPRASTACSGATSARAAQRLFSRISPADRALASARIAVQSRQRRGLQAAIDAVPASRQDDPGLLYDRAQYRRRTDQPVDAMQMAARINPREAPLAARADIFTERRLYVPRAMRAGNYSLAYQLVSNHGLTSGEAFADAEWLAGWLSLRYPRPAATRRRALLASERKRLLAGQPLARALLARRGGAGAGQTRRGRAALQRSRALQLHLLRPARRHARRPHRDALAAGNGARQRRGAQPLREPRTGARAAADGAKSARSATSSRSRSISTTRSTIRWRSNCCRSSRASNPTTAPRCAAPRPGSSATSSRPTPPIR